MATTDGTAPAVPALTLCKGAKPAAFDTLTVMGNIEVNVLSDRLAKALAAQFPQLSGLRGADFTGHPDHYRYSALYEVYAVEAPILIGAWAGDDPAPSVDDILNSHNRERIACLLNVLDKNPDLAADLPTIAALLDAKKAQEQSPNA